MSRSVLVVEDYSDLCAAIVETLARRDFVCDSARTPEEAVVKLRHQHYEAILLSPRLPIRSDPVMQFLHAAQPEEICKVILMTCESAEAVGDPDSCRMLLKPFNNEELMAQLDA